MNILSQMLEGLANAIGASLETLTTTSKTLVGAINEIKASLTVEHERIHISTVDPTAADGNDGDIWIKYVQ